MSICRHHRYAGRRRDDRDHDRHRCRRDGYDEGARPDRQRERYETEVQSAKQGRSLLPVELIG
ncbi:hypothetical protein GCM10027569_08030 [Flindersiella endophytica]